MVIARSLTTLLSFKVDKKGFNNFNSLINGVKRNIFSTQTILVGAFSGITKILSTMATNILDLDQFSRSTGIATKQFVGMQKAAEKFRINPQNFQGAISNLDMIRKEAISGSGALYDIAQQTGLAIRDEKGNILPLFNIFESLIDYLNKIEDSTERSRIAFNLLGDSKFADIGKVGAESFREMSESLEYLADDLEKNKEAALKFEQSLNGVINSATALAYKVFPPLFGMFSTIFEEAGKLVDSLAADIERLKTGETYNSPKLAYANALSRQTGNNLDNLSRGVFGDRDALRKNIEVSNTINIEIPPGTSADQAAFLQASAQESFDVMFNNKFLEILTDNPQTE